MIAAMSAFEKLPDLEEGLRLDALERQQITDTPRDEAFDRLVHIACTALAAPVGAISFLESERLWVKAAQGMSMCETARDTSFCTHAILSDEPLIVEDASRDPRFAAAPQTRDAGLRFYAGAPLITREGFRLGTLHVADTSPRKINGRDRTLLIDMAAIAMGELELRRRAGTDSLTGLYTRRFFQEVAGRELIKARRDGKALTAAFIDRDHSRRVQDGLGHAPGEVLKALGATCRRALRDSDLLGRHDAEELVVLLPGASRRQALPVLERLRADIAALKLAGLEGLEGLTVSIGAAELMPEDLTLGDLLDRAGQALGRAKRSGCNRVARAA